MTPCERLGYKVGDRFVVIQQSNSRAKVGWIVVLSFDDGSDNPFFKKDGENGTNEYCPKLSEIRPLKTTTTIKSGDEITRDGKKYRVTLEEIPQYDFKPGMMCRVVWDGSEWCVNHTESTCVVFVEYDDNTCSKIHYQHSSGSLCTGFVNTANLRPE